MPLLLKFEPPLTQARAMYRAGRIYSAARRQHYVQRFKLLGHVVCRARGQTEAEWVLLMGDRGGVLKLDHDKPGWAPASSFIVDVLKAEKCVEEFEAVGLGYETHFAAGMRAKLAKLAERARLEAL
jgi:hypothetical protein